MVANKYQLFHHFIDFHIRQIYLSHRQLIFIRMPWFESSKEKQLRLLIQDKMKICITRPNQYQNGFSILDSYVRKPNQKVIEMIVDHIKELIKDQGIQTKQKYQAMVLLKDLMQSHSKPLGKYVSKKILKRLTIFAEHKKGSKDQKRGRDIFSAREKQPEYAQKFLNVLLLAIEEWGTKWPRSADGPHQQFHSAYNELLMEKGVQFPMKTKQPNRNSLPKGFRNSPMEEKKTPPKITGSRSPKNIQNAPTQPVIKQKAPLSKDTCEHFQKIINVLGSLIQMLDANPQFNDMWFVIKDIVSETKKIIQEGDIIMASLMEKDGQSEQNIQIIQKINANFEFMTGLQKDTGIIDRKNQKYSIYNSKYSKKCKKIIASLQKDLQGSKKMNFSDPKIKNKNQSSKTIEGQAQTSMGRKVQQREIPKIQHKNQYNSTNDLKRQLELGINQIRKQDFNSNNHKHSQGSDSSRYNSKSGKNNRNSVQSPAVLQKKEGEYIVKEEDQKKKQEKSQENIQRDNQKMNKIEEIRRQETGISKITQKNESQSQLPGSNVEFQDFSQIKRDKSKKDDSFANFQVPSQVKEVHEDSNSDFFNEVENRQKKQNIGMVVPRKNRRGQTNVNHKNNQEENPFDTSVKSKVDSDGLSAFAKSKSNVKSDQKFESSRKMQEKAEQEAPKLGFDTFKSPNQINRAFEQMNKSRSSKRSGADSDQNPFESKFSRKQIERPRESANNLFSSQVNNRDQNASQNENPFDTTQKNQDDNPFSTNLKASQNPFQSNMKESQNPFQSNMKESQNPFSSNMKESQNPFQSNIKQNRNPYESNIRGSQNPFDSKTAFENQKISQFGGDPFREKIDDENIFSSQYKPAASKNQGEQIMSGKFYTGRSSDNKSDQKSQSSNPFSQKNRRQNSEKNSQYQKPPLPSKRKSSSQNPFQKKSQKSITSNPFEKETQKYQSNQSYRSKTSVQNPFQKEENQNPFDTTNNVQGFDKNQKSLSDRESFKDTGKLKGVKKKVSMDDPFETNERKNTQIRKPSIQMSQNGAQGQFKDSFNFDKQQNPRKSIQDNQDGFNFDDFNNLSQRKSQQNNSVSRKSKSGFDFDDFGNFDKNSKKSQQNSFNDYDFFAKQSKRASVENKGNTSDFFKNNQPQSKSRESEKTEKNSFTDFFKGNDIEKNKSNQPEQKSRNSLNDQQSKFQLNFDDFQNYSQSRSSKRSSQNKKTQNPFKFNDFSQNRKPQKKESIESKGFHWDNFGNISQQQSHHQNSKVIEEAKQFQGGVGFINNHIRQSERIQQKFDEIPWEQHQENKDEQIQYKISVNTNSNIVKRDLISPTHHQPQFYQISPFQKKQVRWDGTLGVLPSTNRYSITNQELERKKKEAEEKKRINGEKLRKYQQVKDYLQNLKKQYRTDLDKIVQARQQKKQFINVLNRLKEMNEMKQKDIQEKIKKISHAEELKKQILERQRILYDWTREQVTKIQKKTSLAKNIGNKWERFNSNLDKLRTNDLNMTKNYQGSFSMAYSHAY